MFHASFIFVYFIFSGQITSGDIGDSSRTLKGGYVYDGYVHNVKITVDLKQVLYNILYWSWNTIFLTQMVYSNLYRIYMIWIEIIIWQNPLITDYKQTSLKASFQITLTVDNDSKTTKLDAPLEVTTDYYFGGIPKEIGTNNCWLWRWWSRLRPCHSTVGDH